MDNIRIMQDDLKNASQSPKSVATAFTNNIKNNSQPVQPSPAVKPPVVANKVTAPNNLPFAPIAPLPPLPLKKDSPLDKKEDIFKPTEPSIPVKPSTPLKPLPMAPSAIIQKEEPSGFFQSRGFKLSLVGVLVIVLLAGGAFGYFKYFAPSYKNNGGIDTGINNNNDQTPVIPQSLITVATTIEISLPPEGNAVDFVKDKVGSSILEKGSYHRVLIYDAGTLLSLDAFLDKFNLSIDQELKSLLTNNYTFFVYVQESGLRYGLALKSSDYISISTIMTGWESEMFQDLANLYLNSSPQLVKNVKNAFKDNNDYSSVIRYLNLPDTETTLDYTLSKNLLLITTSKESMIGLVQGL